MCIWNTNVFCEASDSKVQFTNKRNYIGEKLIMGTNGNMKSVAEIMNIIENQYTYIPLLQRNYKWTMECASELAEDLWDSYTNGKPYQLNMITIYKDERDNSLQVLDGQQRLITLKLFLTFLKKNTRNINFAFERDFKINERKGRRYFIDYYLTKDKMIQYDMEMSVDVKRLYDNFTSMIIPVSFRSVFDFYRICLEDSIKRLGMKEDQDKTKILNAKEHFNNELIPQIMESRLKEIISPDKIEDVKQYMRLENDEIDIIYNLCQQFNDLFTKLDKDNEMDNDEIRISKYSNQYQEIWNRKIHKVINEIGTDNVISEEIKKNLTNYIKENVEMLYHETTSEPIDEFLNINENKTRFVISDYIRANMISDNPIDGDIDNSTKKINQKNRDEVLRLFGSLSNYLYSSKYHDMWELIKRRYDDFEKNTDINRLKILFCDKYAGVSTKGYSYETELQRLQYFEMILKGLSNEIGLVKNELDKKIIWNTYNAIYMLLECKHNYRFFSLFTHDDIQRGIELQYVAIRERFCFFEWAYELSKDSEDPWDISYFLESQLCEGKCNTKKSKQLPEKMDDEWCVVNRGCENDALHDCIQQLIDNIKEQSNNE